MISARQPHGRAGRDRKAALPERAQPHPIRFGPNLYIAHTQPGFEAIAADEIATRISAAREITRRVVPDRAGMTIFFAPTADKLGVLRTAEDLFGLAGYRAGVGPENFASGARADSAEVIRSLFNNSRNAPMIALTSGRPLPAEAADARLTRIRALIARVLGPA